MSTNHVIKGLDEDDNTEDFVENMYLRVSPETPVYSVKKEYVMGYFLSGLSHSARAVISLSEIQGFASHMPDELLKVIVEFLNKRKGLDLFVTNKNEPFGFKRNEHDVMNPIYVGDDWAMSIKEYRDKKDMWLVNLSRALVPDPDETYDLIDSFNYAEFVIRMMDYLGLNGLHHLASARLKFLLRSYHVYKPEKDYGDDEDKLLASVGDVTNLANSLSVPYVDAVIRMMEFVTAEVVSPVIERRVLDEKDCVSEGKCLKEIESMKKMKVNMEARKKKSDSILPQLKSLRDRVVSESSGAGSSGVGPSGVGPSGVEAMADFLKKNNDAINDYKKLYGLKKFVNRARAVSSYPVF